MPGSTR